MSPVLSAPPGGRHGAPGVFLDLPARSTALRGVRRDLAVFAGVAPRGPARVRERATRPDETVADYLSTVATQRSIAVQVDSWTEYQRWFGGFEGPGRLPYAVSAFFAQGGRRARVVRIVHDYPSTVSELAGCSSGVLGGATTTLGDAVEVAARNEGSWGDRLRGTLRFAARPLLVTAPSDAGFEVARSEWVPIGSLLRCTTASGERALRYVADSAAVPYPDRPGSRRIVSFDTALPSAPVAVEVITATLDVSDDDPAFPRAERLTDLGLSADHPRWLARAIVDESELLWVTGPWVSGALHLTDPELPDLPLASTSDPVQDHLLGGADRDADLVPDDFFDPDWVPGDERVGAGVQCIAELLDAGMLVAPDLYDPAPLDEPEPVIDPAVGGGPDFAPCVDLPAAVHPPAIPPLSGLRLDPAVPAELAIIVRLQSQLVAFAQQCRGFTVLLDAPLGLTTAQLLHWRAAFDTSAAAAYHPWLDVATPEDSRDGLVRINPSAFAAGVIAARELSAGVFAGPANVVVAQAVRPAVSVPDAEHDDLHDAGINVYRTVRDGLRLTGARTLSRDPQVRQLSVARLLTVIELTLERELAWAVFEPNGPALWATVRRTIGDYLDELRRAGALAGTKASDAYFIDCDPSTMSTNDLDNGRLIAVIGVAPVEPVEYVVLRLTVDEESTARVEVSRG